MVQLGGYAAVVVEASLEDMVFRPPMQSRLAPQSVLGTWAAWSQRYSVPWVWAGNRRLAERCAWELLEKFWKERQEPA